MNKYLETWGIATLNSGANDGTDWWPIHSSGEMIHSINPANGQKLASICRCTSSELQHIIDNSHIVFNSWKKVPAPKRSEVIRQIGKVLRAKKIELAHLVSLESGKSAAEGLGEVQEMIDMADFAVGQSRMLYGNTMHSERPEHRLYEQWHPLGVVGVISAFNFPVAVWAWNAFIAAIVGNTVIWKPSSKTPLCAIAVQKICNQVTHETGYPGVFSLIISDHLPQLAELVDDPRIPLISFTGSTKVGRQVSIRVAQRLGRCLLELGGNNATIIDESANLDLAVPAVVFGAIGTAGQRCTTTRRLIIQESIYGRILPKLIDAYRQISIGDPLEEKNLMGPLIDQAAVNQYRTALVEVQAAGGEILYGGQVLNLPGFFVEPTLVRAENHWDIVQQETFAPILYLLTYRTIEEAITLHNQVSQGLSSALFTNDLRQAEYFLSAQGSDCGLANVNTGTSGAEIGGAFGGEKATGGGREAGSDAWKAYMRRQTVTINWGLELPLAQGILFKSGD